MLTTIQALPVFLSISVPLSPLLFWATRSQTGHSSRVNVRSTFLSSQANELQRTFRQCSGTWVLLQDTAFADSLTSTGSRSPAVATDPEHHIHPVLLKLWLSSYLKTHLEGWLPSICLLHEHFAGYLPSQQSIGFKNRYIPKFSKNPPYLWYWACKSNSTVWRTGIQEFF